MERREQYDPEDIESLLEERGFDELLEEERAYVLRHLSGREEYEQMRALLLHVREADRSDEPLVADEQVRANVLQAFREQQKPQWRIWLNAIGPLFAHDRAPAWRPALALGMLMLLFGIGFYLVNGPLAGPATDELAEVRREKAESTPRPIGDTLVPKATTDGNTAAGGETVKNEDAMAPASPAQTSTATFHSAVESQSADVELEEAPLAETLTEPVLDTATGFAGVAEKATSAEVYTMTEADLARNQSLANASGTVRATAPSRVDTRITSSKMSKAERTAASSRPLSQDPQLLDLLSAGW